TPESDTVSTGFAPECLNVSVAVRLPATEGVNRSVTAQLELAARFEPQALVAIEKSPASVPEMSILLMVIEPVPRFLRVTTWGLPVTPTSTSPQVTTNGETPTAETLVQPV